MNNHKDTQKIKGDRVDRLDIQFLLIINYAEKFIWNILFLYLTNKRRNIR